MIAAYQKGLAEKLTSKPHAALTAYGVLTSVGEHFPRLAFMLGKPNTSIKWYALTYPFTKVSALGTVAQRNAELFRAKQKQEAILLFGRVSVVQQSEAPYLASNGRKKHASNSGGEVFPMQMTKNAD